MKEQLRNQDGKIIVEKILEVIHRNRDYLSEIDGAIGDGDHGINMDKGATLTEKEIQGKEMSMSEAFRILGKTMVMEIGGAMGPLYGAFFKEMAKASKNHEQITLDVVIEMLEAAYAKMNDLGHANVGDKTLMDTLVPALNALKDAKQKALSFTEALDTMNDAAEQGWKSTENLVAKVGRSSRLGERSKGVLDAGATSCFFILHAMANAMKELLNG